MSANLETAASKLEMKKPRPSINGTTAMSTDAALGDRYQVEERNLT